MTIKTDLSKKQLTTILSALDDAPRNPANKGEALRAIGRSAAKLGLTTDDEDVLAAAPGLLDERLTPAEFRAELAADAGAPEASTEVADTRTRTTTKARRPTTRPRLRPPARPRSRRPAPARGQIVVGLHAQQHVRVEPDNGLELERHLGRQVDPFLQELRQVGPAAAEPPVKGRTLAALGLAR